ELLPQAPQVALPGRACHHLEGGLLEQPRDEEVVDDPGRLEALARRPARDQPCDAEARRGRLGQRPYVDDMAGAAGGGARGRGGGGGGRGGGGGGWWETGSGASASSTMKARKRWASWWIRSRRSGERMAPWGFAHVGCRTTTRARVRLSVASR